MRFYKTPAEVFMKVVEVLSDTEVVVVRVGGGLPIRVQLAWIERHWERLG